MTPTKQNCSECQFEKGHALICSQFEIPVKENQEKEFDNMTPTNKENWEKDFWEIVEELGTGGYIVCFQKIRDFIRQDFISREKVEKAIEKKIQEYPEWFYHSNNEREPHPVRKALSDFRRELTKNK